MVERWKEQGRRLKRETYAVYPAYQDTRSPWYARLFAACVVGYAFSPIDLVPDFIPVLGYLDDLVLVPVGILLAVKMIPSEVIAECREKREKVMAQDKPVNRAAAAAIITIWLLMVALVVVLIRRALLQTRYRLLRSVW